MEKILILEDHCGYTATSLTNGVNGSIDNSKLKQYLEKKGYIVNIASLHDIDNNLIEAGTYVYYPSSEVVGLFYKEYIGDVLLELAEKGMILLPPYKFFRAHHNKVFMERLRENLADESLKTIHSVPIYDERDLKKSIETIEKKIGYPAVVKTSSGSGARGVALAHNREQLIALVSKMGRVTYSDSSIPWYSSPFLSKIKTCVRKVLHKTYIERTYPREKIVIQNFIPNLQYDYKVLVFGEKYYVLKRLTRDNDFRASGSGKLIFPDTLTEEICQVLDSAKKIYDELDVPMLSVDVAFDGTDCHIIEFQCVSFGPYTLQFSEQYYILDVENRWNSVSAKSELEREIAMALDRYIRTNN